VLYVNEKVERGERAANEQDGEEAEEARVGVRDCEDSWKGAMGTLNSFMSWLGLSWIVCGAFDDPGLVCLSLMLQTQL